MTRLWSTYVRWYELLVDWAALLVPEDAARRCARRCLALMAQQALNAVETMDGPYMKSTDELYALICMQRDPVEEGLLSWAYREMPYPDEELVRDIAELYAALFMCGYTAGLSLRDRIEITALIRLYDPQDMSLQRLNASLRTNLPETHPLRRVVAVLGGRVEANPHMGAMGKELWDDEEQRGLAWLKRQTIENGAL